LECGRGAAERTFAALAKGPASEAFEYLQPILHEDANVHRVVLAWRAWALLDVAGQEQAHTLLRQSVHFCVGWEQYRLQKRLNPSTLRALLRLPLVPWPSVGLRKRQIRQCLQCPVP
jgi:hypothetical protein